MTKAPSASSIAKAPTSTKGLDIIIVGVIALIFFLSPIFFTGLAAQGIGFEKMILFFFLVLIGIVAWVTKGVIIGELDLKRTPLDLPILVTIAAFIVSTFLSVSVKDSLIGAYGSSAKGLLAVVIFALFYYLVVNNLTTSRIKIFFSSFLAATSLVSLYTLLQLKGIYILPMLNFTKSTSFNPLGSVSALTMFLLIALPMLVVAVTQTKKIYANLPAGLIVAIKSYLGLALLATLVILGLLNGFTFWPVAIIGSVIVLMFFLSKVIKTSNNNLLIPLTVFLVLIILLVLGNFNIKDLGLPAEVSLSRSASWEIAKASLKQDPIFGSGPATYYYSFAKYRNIDFNSSPLWNVRFDSASGAGYELINTVGVVGALSVLVLLLISLSLSFITLIKMKDKEIHAILLGLFAGFVSAILLALLFALNNSLILITVLVSVLTMAVSLFMYPEKFKEIKLSFRASPKYALGLAAIFLTVSAGVVVLFTMGLKMYLADVYAKEALANTKDLTKKISLLEKSTSLAPYQDGYYLSLANSYMALANQQAISGGDQSEAAKNIRLAIERGKKSVEIAPNKAANNEALALIYENASFYERGVLEWAEKHYNKITELDPNNPTPYLRTALVNMARANAETNKDEKKFYTEEAIKKYDQALSKKGDLAAAYYGKSVAYERLDNIEEAIKQLRQASILSDNLDYRFELGRLYFNLGVTQPDLTQTASRKIAENDITPNEDGSTTTKEVEDLSVKPVKVGGIIDRNKDINTAEQLFLSIVLVNPKHANARYSLAVLYQKIGDNAKARIMVDALLKLLTDQRQIDAVKKQFASIYQ